MDILETCVYMLATSVQIFLSVLLFLMFLRAILSWFVSPESGILLFLNTVTEPFVAPVRYLMVKLNLLQDSPMDFSFMIAYLLIWMISLLLPPIAF